MLYKGINSSKNFPWLALFLNARERFLVTMQLIRPFFTSLVRRMNSGRVSSEVPVRPSSIYSSVTKQLPSKQAAICSSSIFLWFVILSLSLFPSSLESRIYFPIRQTFGAELSEYEIEV